MYPEGSTWRMCVVKGDREGEDTENGRLQGDGGGPLKRQGRWEQCQSNARSVLGEALPDSPGFSVLGVLLQPWTELACAGRAGEGAGPPIPARSELLFLSSPPTPVPTPAGIQPLRPWLCQQLVFNNLCTARTQVHGQSCLAAESGDA